MTRKITIAGLALILFGGVVSPSVVHADSTGTTDNATAATTKANDSAETTIKIGSIGMPYTLISDKDGNTKYYTYPNAPTVLTATEINNDEFMNNILADYPNISIDQSSLQQILETPVTINLNESYLDYMYDAYGAAEGLTKDELRNGLVLQAYAVTWLASHVAQKSAGKITFDQLQSDYQNSLQKKLASSALTAGTLSMTDKMFADEPTYDAVGGIVYASLVGNSALSNYSDAKLMTLDSDASYRQMVSLLNKPMSDYYIKQADGTYQMSGLLLNGLQAYSFWFEEKPSIPDPTPTPTPSASQPVTVHYVDDQGNTLKPDKTLTGKLGDSYKTEPLDIDGYGLTNTTGDETGTFSNTAKSVTYTYAPVITSGGGNDTIAPEGTVIYATKKIGLYKHATFTNKARKQWYAKKARINRPMFVVTGYAKSKNGVKRYQVKDVNHHSKTNGKTGYVTANAKYTSRVYYATKHKTITVINPKGVNAYSKKTLTNKKAHYKQGQVLKVKKIVNQNLTTRFVLSNGRYITANKMLIQSGKQTMPKRVQTKTGLNRYSTANLTKQNKHVSAHAILKVTGWTYSNANNFSKSDTLRYQVAGGYITGNKQLVRVFK
ncbi:DUF5776 domain-containing protein [Levilactobacillus fuyuanensis]|uniref:DUF5776 domain-containing protein n=2 Tax=Levilactobacillus fuyuanensis TaxID=2486022 RepID=A0ABW4H2L6_9LACO|nr:DUF5776 domain-containing protein [Levilactobacillus fuyuanensis]